MIRIIQSEIPQKAGWYFVKSNLTNFWQYMVLLEGEAPFLSVRTKLGLYDVECLKFPTKLNDLIWSDEIAVADVIVEVDKRIDVNHLITLIRRSEKLLAVKTLKEWTGWGLKEAKEYCDDLQDKIRNN